MYKFQVLCFGEESFYESWATYERLSHIFINGGDLLSQIKNHLCCFNNVYYNEATKTLVVSKKCNNYAIMYLSKQSHVHLHILVKSAFFYFLYDRNCSGRRRKNKQSTIYKKTTTFVYLLLVNRTLSDF